MKQLTTTLASQGRFGSHNKRIIHKVSKLPILTALLTFGALSASAAPIYGTFNISGSVTVGGLFIDWSSNGPTTGTFSTNSPSTGFFAGLFGGNPPFYTGTVKDLNGPPVVSRFLDLFTAPTFGGLYFDLAGIVAPTASACVGNPALNTPCALGSFTLTNTASGVAVDFGLFGFVQNGLDATTRTSATGLYSTQLLGTNIGAVAATLNGGGSIASSYSATYSSVPESSSIWLMCIGGGLLGMGAYRKRSTKSN